MAGVLSLPKALAAAATLCLLATSCGKAPSKGTIQEPRPAESAESLEYMSVHSPPGFAYKGSTVRLVFRPICHSESDCLSASGTLSFNIDGSVLQQDLTFDANLGLYADVTVVSSLSYRAELKSGGLTSSWPPGPGMQEVPTLETKTIDVGFDLPDPVTISEPKWSVPIPTGRGGGQIGSSDQGRDSGDTSCHRTRARLL